MATARRDTRARLAAENHEDGGFTAALGKSLDVVGLVCLTRGSDMAQVSMVVDEVT